MSEYVDLINEMVWSYSRVSSFHNCRYEFYLKYIIQDEEMYLPEGNFYADFGIFVHDIFAKIFSNELNPEEALLYYSDNYEENIFYKAKQSVMSKRFELCYEYLSSMDIAELNNYEILGVELELEFEIEGYPFTSFIDLLLRNKKTGSIILIDHKSAHYPATKSGGILKRLEHSFDSYKKQMYLYCCAIKEKFGEYPSLICWNHFLDDGQVMKLKFDFDEYETSISWFLNTIHDIENEEDFEPNENFFYCTNLCSFRNSCEYCAAHWK